MKALYSQTVRTPQLVVERLTGSRLSLHIDSATSDDVESSLSEITRPTSSPYPDTQLPSSTRTPPASPISPSPPSSSQTATALEQTITFNSGMTIPHIVRLFALLQNHRTGSPMLPAERTAKKRITRINAHVEAAAKRQRIPINAASELLEGDRRAGRFTLFQLAALPVERE